MEFLFTINLLPDTHETNNLYYNYHTLVGDILDSDTLAKDIDGEFSRIVKIFSQFYPAERPLLYTLYTLFNHSNSRTNCFFLKTINLICVDPQGDTNDMRNGENIRTYLSELKRIDFMSLTH
jgi:hypothetical protein